MKIIRLKLIELIKNESNSLTSARNAGIEFAKGRWILTLNSGDNIHPELICKIIDKSDIVGTVAEEIYLYSFFRKEVWEKIKGYNESMIDRNADSDFFTKAVKLPKENNYHIVT